MVALVTWRELEVYRSSPSVEQITLITSYQQLAHGKIIAQGQQRLLSEEHSGLVVEY